MLPPHSLQLGGQSIQGTGLGTTFFNSRNYSRDLALQNMPRTLCSVATVSQPQVTQGKQA